MQYTIIFPDDFPVPFYFQDKVKVGQVIKFPNREGDLEYWVVVSINGKDIKVKHQ